MPLKISQGYSFGPFLLDLEQHRVFRDGVHVPLTPKAFDTLLALVGQRGRLMTKEALMKEVWAGTFVEEGNLAVNISAIRKALGKDDAGREYIETIPRFGYRFAAQVRSAEPVAEPESGASARRGSDPRLLGPLGNKRSLLSPGAEEASRGWPSRIVMLVAIAAVVAVALGAVLWLARPYRKPASQRARPAIAVLGFQNLSGRVPDAWLATALTEMIGTELSSGGALRVVPSEDTARMKAELPLTVSDSLSRTTLEKVKENLDSDYVVLGSYAVLDGGPGGQIRVDVRIQEARGGEALRAITVTGSQEHLFELVTAIGAQMRQELGTGRISPGESQVIQSKVRTAMPVDPDAARDYARGLEKLRMFDSLAARDSLVQAVAREPSFPLAHAALSQVWSTLGYDARAREEAKLANDLASDLPPEQRVMVEARYHETIGEWDNAAGIYRALFALHPDEVDYGLRLAGAQVAANHGTDASASLRELRKAAPASAEDPRLDIAESQVAGLASDHARQISAAERAIAKARASGARMLLGQALMQRETALYQLGRIPEAKNDIQEARAIYESLGYRKGIADAVNSLAMIVDDEGDMATAEKLYKEFGDISAEIGDRRGVADSYTNLSQLYSDQANYSEALSLCQKALPIYQETGERNHAAASYGNCGNALTPMGDPIRARQMYQAAIDIYRQTGDQAGIALQLHNLAEVLADAGDLKGARTDLEQALSIWQEQGNRRSVSYARFNLGETLRKQGDLSSAREQHNQSLALRSQLGDAVAVAESKLALAELSLDDGNSGPAVAVCPEVIKLFQTQKSLDDEIAAHGLLARALLAKGELKQAEESARKAAELLARSQDRRVHMQVEIDVARLMAAVGKDGAAARKRLATVIAEARQNQLVAIELDARLASLELRNRAAGVVETSAERLALIQDAQARGFGLIARKAKE